MGRAGRGREGESEVGSDKRYRFSGGIKMDLVL
jgi:hypothetical protein